jgi:gliding motility-associated-like protein
MRHTLVASLFFALLSSNCKKDSSSTVDSTQIFVPTAFTPNGDHVNDSFVIKGNNLEYYSIIIYDKDNNLVFSSTNINKSWDGTYLGKPAPAGSYTWVIDFKVVGGNEQKLSGYVELVR